MTQTKNFKPAWEGKDPRFREIDKDEIIIEFDNCNRKEGLEYAEKTIKKINGRYRLEIWDHNGKSPHIHIKNIRGLKELTPKQRALYKKSFLRKYAGNPDKADVSLCTKHLIAKEMRRVINSKCEHSASPDPKGLRP